jgi:hypothetical protein
LKGRIARRNAIPEEKTMTRKFVWALLAVGAAGCATTSPTSEGAKVKVYEADAKIPAESRRLPEGCRLLETTAPVDQMESERLVTDPYRSQRNAAAARGGNVLLVLSDRIRSLPKTDCAPSDTSPDCQSRSQNWYKVSFQSYACDATSLDALAALQPNPTGVAAWWPFGKEKPKENAPAAAPAAASPTANAPAVAAAPVASGVAPSELKAKLLVLMREGVGTDVLVAYVKSKPVSAALTAEEIVDWKKSGIADSVIEAALAQAPSAR